MTPRPKNRARARRPTHPVPRSSTRAPSPSPWPTPPRLTEPPHSHIVCRSCGRIATVDLVEGERQLLIALAARHPDTWTVDRIAFSLTGFCARCREGPRA
jgi:hypothetical protein